MNAQEILDGIEKSWTEVQEYHEKIKATIVAAEDSLKGLQKVFPVAPKSPIVTKSGKRVYYYHLTTMFTKECCPGHPDYRSLVVMAVVKDEPTTQAKDYKIPLSELRVDPSKIEVSLPNVSS